MSGQQRFGSDMRRLCETAPLGSRVWQQRRREQIPYNHIDSTKEKDPKGQPTERTWTAQRRAKA